jgi:hypothetical protein
MFFSFSRYPNMFSKVRDISKNIIISIKINIENLSDIFSFNKNNLQQSKIRAISMAITEYIIKFKAKTLSTISIFEEKSTLINLIHSTRLK